VADVPDASELGERDAAVGRVAAWLHDAVYDPGGVVAANETASAALAESLRPRVRLDGRLVEEVVDG
jgi:predicted metal-dependent HD superfamily phosphohydrolase